MTKPAALQWLPQPSTVIGLGTLAGTFCYWITRDPIWAGVAAAVVTILVPDNSTGGDRAFEAIAMLARSAGRPLKAAAEQPSFASGAGKKSSPVVPGGTGENDERSDQRQRLVGRT